MVEWFGLSTAGKGDPPTQIHTHTQARHGHLGEGGPWHRAARCGGPGQLSSAEMGELRFLRRFGLMQGRLAK